MSRKTKDKAKAAPKPPRTPLLERRGFVLGLKICLVVAGLTAVGAGLKVVEHLVLGLDGQSTQAVVVRLAQRPQWMPESLATSICGAMAPDAREVMQHDLTRRVYAQAAGSPWIRKVHYVWRRGTEDPGIAVLEISAEFRQPIARVKVPSGLRYLSGPGATLTDGQSKALADYCFVSDDGTILPGDQVPQYTARITPADGGSQRTEFYVTAADVPFNTPVQRIHYITIFGAAASDATVGTVWLSRDLLDGLRLTKMTLSEPWADQITVVDVRNHGGRISTREPHLRMWAQSGRGRATDIRFGQFPRTPGDYVVPTEVKWAQLNDFVTRNNGRLAGTKAFVDLRYDDLHVSVN